MKKAFPSWRLQGRTPRCKVAAKHLLVLNGSSSSYSAPQRLQDFQSHGAGPHPPEELDQLLRGSGWTPYYVEGDKPTLMHQQMAATLDQAVADIQAIQHQAREAGDLTRPRGPLIVLKFPKARRGPNSLMAGPTSRFVSNGMRSALEV
jgi:hypothetical protein